MSRARLPLAAALLLACPCGPLHAQGTWDAILTVDPYPSPYYSDWDANPDIATLTLINGTASTLSVRIHFNVTDHSNRIVVSGRSDPEQIAAGATVIFDSPYDVAGSTTHDTEMEEVAARTGRMPEGDYTACAVAVDGAGFVLAESCAPFTIVYPDPPLLLGPMDGEVIDQQDPLFLWTPVQVPVDYQLSYVMRVVEVLPNQAPGAALRENVPHYETVDGQLTSLRYPIDAQPFETGKTYAWSVQALDQNGYTAAANDGRSEIWTFRYTDQIPVPRESPPGTFDLSIGFYDAGSEDAPELLELIGNGRFDELVDYILTAAREGRLELRLPGPALLGGLLPGDADAPGGLLDADRQSGGPFMDDVHIWNPATPPQPALASCLEFLLPGAQAEYSDTKKAIAIRVKASGTPLQDLLGGCFGVPDWSRPFPGQDEWEVMFAVSWKAMPPRVILALKPPLFDLVPGSQFTHMSFVVNLVGEFTLKSDDLPDEVGDFFGDHELEVWGPGIGEWVRHVVGKVRHQPTASSSALGLLGVNFYAFLDYWSMPRPLQAFADFVGVPPDSTIVLRGFLGSREKSYLGVSGGPLRIRDNWFLLATVPVSPWGFLPGATERRFELEIGSQDTSVAAVPGLRDMFVGTPEAEMLTRYRVVARDVVGGFDNLKARFGIPRDSTFELYGEYRLEWTGDRTLAQPRDVMTVTDSGGIRRVNVTESRTVTDSSSWGSRTQFTVTYGTHVRINLFDGYLNFFDPKLIIGRKDHTQPMLTNPLKNGWVFVGSDFGSSGQRLGHLDIQLSTGPETPPPDTSRAKLAAYAKLTRLKQEADSLEERYWVMNEQLSTEVARLPAGDTAAYNHAIRNDEILRVVMAEVRNLKQRSDAARRAYEAELRKDPTAMPKTKLSVKFAMRFETGASIGFLLKLAVEFGKGLLQ